MTLRHELSTMRLASLLLLLSMLPVALANGQGTILLDQIGAADGSDINTFAVLQNQVDPANPAWDTAIIEPFQNPDGLPLSRIDTVIGGSSGYSGIDGIAAMRLLVFTSIEAAVNGDLSGDVLEVEVPGAPQADSDWAWAGTRDLVSIHGGPWSCPAGSHWIAVVPVNEFSTNGMTTQIASWIGDDTCWQVNPSGSNGWTEQELPYNAAIRIAAGACALPLPEQCTGDVSGGGGSEGPDGVVNVDDLLTVIANFGAVGDNWIRPTGDCAPLPFGDCEVTVDDLLQVISDFGADCIPTGACCFGLDGCQDAVTEAGCASQDGDWLGDETLCTACIVGACCSPDGSCLEVLDTNCTGIGATFHGAGVACDDVECTLISGACCVDTENCLVGTVAECLSFGGVFMGDGTTCVDALCGAVNNSCETSLLAILGPNPFDTTNATDSGFGPPDENMCPGTFLNWDDSPDVWFRWVAPWDTLLTITTCDENSFDTSIVVYEGPNCPNLAQIACNGDGDGELGCQTYWSRIVNLPVYAGQHIWIRVGGYDGAVGAGTLTLEADEDQIPGACCVDGTCIPEQTQFQCMALLGVYIGPMACDDVQCPGDVTPCEGTTGEDPVAPADDWISGTSDTGVGIMRAQSVVVSGIQTLTVHGLSLSFSGGWAPCTDPDMTFDVRAWDSGADGLPGELLLELQSVPASMALTGTVYPTALGNFGLVAWTIDVASDVNARWLSVQSNSVETGDCLFLWMSSTEEGMGYSLVDDGSGWQDEHFDLNYCIEE